jgi:hypothetical protein
MHNFVFAEIDDFSLIYIQVTSRLTRYPIESDADYTLLKLYLVGRVREEYLGKYLS